MRVWQSAAGTLIILATGVAITTSAWLAFAQPALAESPGLPDTSQDTFQKDVLSSSKPVVVECNAPWCNFCKKLEPVLSEMSKNYAGKASFFQVDVDKNPQLKAQYKIVELPRVLIFQNGKLVNDTLGYRKCQLINSKLDDLITLKK